MFKVLATAGSVWCFRSVRRTQAVLFWDICTVIELLTSQGNTSKAVTTVVARWQVWCIGKAGNLIEKLISVDMFPLADNE